MTKYNLRNGRSRSRGSPSIRVPPRKKPRIIRAVFACCFSRNKKGKVTVLMVKETNGKWGFPGGKLEKREKPLQALQREFKEETKHVIPCSFQLMNQAYIKRSKCQAFYYRCEVAHVFGQNTRWIPFNDIKKLDYRVFIPNIIFTDEGLQTFHSIQ